MRDPYTVLGLAKSASAGEIKSTFRKLAKKFHPDQSKEPKAKERFSEVSQAYEILGDEKKRAAFDNGEIDAEGKPRAPQFEGFGAGGGPGGPGFRNFSFDFNGADLGGGRGVDPEMFAEMFGGAMGARARGPIRGEDIAVTAQVPLAQVGSGGEVRVTLPNGKALDVSVPAGFEDGRAIRLRGQGEPGRRSGIPGDAIVTLRYAPHPYFKIEGRDLRCDLPIALYEAVLGARVRAPTLTGAVELTVPPNTSSGRVLRLRGKGLPGSGDQPAGDLFVTLRIALPQTEDEALSALMREWRENKPYDPRQS